MSERAIARMYCILINRVMGFLCVPTQRKFKQFHTGIAADEIAQCLKALHVKLRIVSVAHKCLMAKDTQYSCAPIAANN